MAWGVVTFAGLAVGGEYFVRLIDDEPTVVEVAKTFILIIPLSIGFMGVMQVASTCFNALGQPVPPLILALLRTFVIYIPVAYLADYWFGYTGIFIATALTNLIMGSLAWRWNQNAVRIGSMTQVRFRDNKNVSLER